MDASIRKLDLNLLKVFDTLFDTCSVSDAANELYITQSAVSHSLRRLRELFDDPLFVSTKTGMVPTQLASHIADSVKDALKLIHRSINYCHAFDPSTSERCFTIYGSEFFETVFLPSLSIRLRKYASNCRIEIRRLAHDIPLDELERGSADMVVSFASYFRVPGNLTQRPFFHEKLVCVVDREHPFISAALSLEQYLAAEHIYPSPWGGTHNMVEAWLQGLGKTRRIKLTAQNYLAAVLSVIGSDYILTLPASLAKLFAKRLPIKVVEPPTGYPSFNLEMVTNRLFENTRPNIWLREQLLSTARDLFDESYTHG